MQLMINGKAQDVKEGSNIEALLLQLNLKADRIAVELNHRIVMRCDFSSILLHAGDKIEIVNFVGGG